jgi:hypothetical protein
MTVWPTKNAAGKHDYEECHGTQLISKLQKQAANISFYLVRHRVSVALFLGIRFAQRLLTYGTKWKH